mmetsp:Transcript_48139/g.138237  ORF Transcript_48139/g.138237 Transcript_48139/m.138237 type:complete len:128 (-) Transcript_48139:168-551(-)
MAYATLLLSFGAERGEPDEDPGAVAEANGRHRLAHLVRHWSGKQVEFLKALRKSPSCACCSTRGARTSTQVAPGALFWQGRRAADTSSCSRRCLVCLPEHLACRIAGFLAPGPCTPEAWAAAVGGEA